MALGRPVIASAVGGLKEIIVDGETGLLVPESDPGAIAAAVSSVLEDRGLAQRIGSGARAYVLKYHTHLRAAREILSFAQEARQAAGRRSAAESTAHRQKVRGLFARASSPGPREVYVDGLLALLDDDPSRADPLFSRLNMAGFSEGLLNHARAKERCGRKHEARRLLRKAGVASQRFTRSAPRRLSLCFLAAHNRQTGGAKVFFELARGLARKGHRCHVLAPVAPPDWLDPADLEWIQAADHNEVVTHLSLVDVAVAMFWSVVEPVFASRAPVKVLLEQGDPSLFEAERCGLSRLEAMLRAYRRPVSIVAVSKHLASAVREKTGRRPHVWPIGVNLRVFRPPEDWDPLQRGRELRAGAERGQCEPRIVVVGDDRHFFKGLREVFRTVQVMRGWGWKPRVLQLSPSGERFYNFERDVRTARSEEEMALHYRWADFYLGASHYESFSLPALEAMACGTAVISTDNGGIREYGRNGVNSLILTHRDPIAMAEALRSLVLDPQAYCRIARGGVETARPFGWERAVDEFEAYLLDLYVNPRARYTVTRVGSPPPERNGFLPKEALQLARFRAGRSDWDGAEEALERGGRLVGLKGNSALIEGLHRLSAEFAAEGAFDLALETNLRALRRSPADVDTLFNLSLLYLQTGKPAEALQYCRRALTLQVDSEILELLAAILEGAGKGGQSARLRRLLEEGVPSLEELRRAGVIE